MTTDKDALPDSSTGRFARFGHHYSNARQFARQRRTLNFTWRLIVLVVGISLLGLGVFFMVFPGPGWATIIIGLIVLGSEYTWAKRALAPIQSTASRIADRARSREMTVKAFAISVSAFMALTTIVYVYMASFGPTFDPVITLVVKFIPGLD